jgi:predicted transcriptional regulator of viral defense system
MVLYVTEIVTWELKMTRTISPSMAGVLQSLELERPSLVTMAELAQILDKEKIDTPARIVASRLRKAGWLLKTGQRGVWEFAPAELAGAYPSGDPLTGLRAYLAKHTEIPCGLTFQAAAWAYGHSDRIPARPEVAVAKREAAKSFPDSLSLSVFTPTLDYEHIDGVPVLAKESIFVHMCEKPKAVRSWGSAKEWIPELSAELKWAALEQELSPRPMSVKARLGYLLKGIRPDLAEQVYASYEPKNKTWFGQRGKLIRHDNHWLIADTTLPFDPGTFEDARWLKHE